MQSSYIKDRLAQAWAGEVAQISLHDDDPLGAGYNEVSFSGYARQSPAGNSPFGTGVVSLDEVIFTIPEGVTITHIGLWTSGGMFIEDRPYAATTAGTTNLKVTVTYTYTEGVEE